MNASQPCPVPFLNAADYPAIGGYIDGRICTQTAILNFASCCVPCPFQDLVYSDGFPARINGAFWVSVPALILQAVLIITFLVLPEKDGHGHYLNWGMVISATIFELCFVIALGAPTNACHDRITPNDMYSSVKCAWTGSLFLFGAMATVSWILVRSLYTHLRVVWNVDLPRWYTFVSHGIGWGLPALFLAISLPITGVSYQAGPLCLPKPHYTAETWFGWYLAFSGIAALMQLATTGYCIAVYAKSLRRTTAQASSTVDTQSSVSVTTKEPEPVSGMYKKKTGWPRVKKVLFLQWRSIVLSILVAVEAIYFSVVYVTVMRTAQQQLTGSNPKAAIDWAICMIINQGDKHPCLDLATKLGLQEDGAIASVTIATLTGILTFLLLVRRSMFIGWYRVLRNPRQYFREMTRKSSIEEAFVFVPPNIVDTEKGHIPKAGDATKRHTTTNIFEQDIEEHVEEDVDEEDVAEHHEVKPQQ